MPIRDFEDKKVTASNYAKDLIMDGLLLFANSDWMKNPFFTKNMTEKDKERVQKQLDKHTGRIARIFHYENPAENHGQIKRKPEEERAAKKRREAKKKAREKGATKPPSKTTSLPKRKTTAGEKGGKGGKGSPKSKGALKPTKMAKDKKTKKGGRQ